MNIQLFQFHFKKTSVPQWSDLAPDSNLNCSYICGSVSEILAYMDLFVLYYFIHIPDQDSLGLPGHPLAYILFEQDLNYPMRTLLFMQPKTFPRETNKNNCPNKLQEYRPFKYSNQLLRRKSHVIIWIYLKYIILLVLTAIYTSYQTNQIINISTNPQSFFLPLIIHAI